MPLLGFALSARSASARSRARDERTQSECVADDEDAADLPQSAVVASRASLAASLPARFTGICLGCIINGVGKYIHYFYTIQNILRNLEKTVSVLELAISRII